MADHITIPQSFRPKVPLMFSTITRRSFLTAAAVSPVAIPVDPATAVSTPTATLNNRWNRIYLDKRIRCYCFFTPAHSSTVHVALSIAGQGRHQVQIFNATTGAFLSSHEINPAGTRSGWRMTYHTASGNLILRDRDQIVTLHATTGATRRVATLKTPDTGTQFFAHATERDTLWAGTYPDASVRRIDLTGTTAMTIHTNATGAGSKYVRSLDAKYGSVAFATGPLDQKLGYYNRKAAKTTYARIPGIKPNSFASETILINYRTIAVSYVNTNNVSMIGFYDAIKKTWKTVEAFGGERILSTPNTDAKYYNEYVYGKREKNVLRINAFTGRIVNEYPVGMSADHIQVEPPNSHGHSIVRIADRYGTIATLNTATGKVTGRRTLNFRKNAMQLEEPFAVNKDLIYVGAYQGVGAFALNKRTGNGEFVAGYPWAQTHVYERLDATHVAYAEYSGANVGIIDTTTNRGRRLAVLSHSHSQSRPFGISTMGGSITVATVAEYGKYGGGLYSINPTTGKVVMAVENPAGKQALTGLTGKDGIFYTTSSPLPALGLDPLPENGRVVAVRARDQKILWSRTIPNAAMMASPIVIGDYVYAASGGTIWKLHKNTGTIAKSWRTGTGGDLYYGWLGIRLFYLGRTHFLHVGRGYATVVNISNGTTTRLTLPGKIHRIGKGTTTRSFYATINATDLIEFSVNIP